MLSERADGERPRGLRPDARVRSDEGSGEVRASGRLGIGAGRSAFAAPIFLQKNALGSDELSRVVNVDEVVAGLEGEAAEPI